MDTIGVDRNARLDALRELFTAATHDASAAMCGWTSGLITVSLDEVLEIPMEEVSSEMGISDELLTMVVLTLDEGESGNLVLVFDDVNGRQLAASLLGREVETSPQWSELEQSALCETGNILGCAYVNALARLTSTRMLPSPPVFIQDFGVSVLQQALMAQAATCDELLVCRIAFRRKSEELNWRVIFVPTDVIRKSMERSLITAS